MNITFLTAGLMVMIAGILFTQPAAAEIRQIYVSNEKSNTLTVLDGKT